MRNRSNDTKLNTADRFERFGELEAAGSSPLYARLSRRIAGDSELLALAAEARAEQPTPNLLFATVQYLLLDGVDHPLKEYYPNLTIDLAEGDPYPHFRSFCLAFEEEIYDLITTRRVQTNAVRRSACLLPAFEHVSRTVDRRSLALVEIGSSAGLNLLFDEYGYEYDGRVRCGVRDSPVQVTSATRGDIPPPLPESAPAVASRVGIDLNPLDVRDPNDVRWLRALIWPEHEDRDRLVREATELARSNPLRVHRGDALDLLPDVVGNVSDEEPLCVFNTHVLYQFPEAGKNQLRTMLDDFGHQRVVYWLSFEWFQGRPTAELTVFSAGTRSERTLAQYDAHGRWIEWLETGVE